MMYTIVSEVAKMTEAQSPGKLSAPTRSKSSTKDAVEALPEKGRVSKSGKISVGTPIALTIGDSNLLSSSTAPEAFSIETPTIRAHKVGKSPNEVCSPCRAPVRKESNRSFLPNKRMHPTAPKISGMGRAENMSTIIFLKDVCAKNAQTYAKTRPKAAQKSNTKGM